MACKHENFEVTDGALEQVSKSGMWILFELNECKDCEHTWLSPYLSLADIDPIPDNFIMTKDKEGALTVVPPLEYLRDVLKIPVANILPPK